MICFEVRVNDHPPVMAGVDDIDVLTAMVSYVASHAELCLEVGGLAVEPGGGRENLRWLDQTLKPGDQVLLRIVETTHAFPPLLRERQDPDRAANLERAYYERLRRRYEGCGSDESPRDGTLERPHS